VKGKDAEAELLPVIDAWNFLRFLHRWLGDAKTCWPEKNYPCHLSTVVVPEQVSKEILV